MKKILVPVDFSDNANKALAAAKVLADKEASLLLILHAYQPYVPDMTFPAGSAGMVMNDDAETAFRERLDAFVDEARKEGFQAEAIWMLGGIQPAIFEAVETHQPDYIVMGRTGEGGFLDKLIGSTATRIALDAPCPVLIVPPQANITTFKEVVYATQLEHNENDVLRRVIPLAGQLGARLSFVKVKALTQPDIQPDGQFIEEMVRQFGIDEADIVERQAGSVIEGIEAYCEEVKADLLVMATRERGFLEEWLIDPSVVRRIVLDAELPMLIYHLR
jgi:nucleotide-binding universal stress UspA family protein